MIQKSTKQILIIIPVIAIVIVLPLFINNNYYMTVLNRVLINCIVVLGLNFITGLTGQMNLGTAGIFALGSYTSSLLSINLGISPWFGLIAAALVGILIGRGLGYPSLRIKGVYLSLTTIGFSEIVRLLMTNLARITGGTQGLRNIPPYSIFGYKFESQRSMYFLFLTFVVIAYLISHRIVYSKWGRVFKSLRDNVDAVEACGVDIAAIKIKAFTLASVYGAIGGAMYAHYMGYINPSSFTLDLSINYVVMLMVGGIGSVAGNIFGAIIVTVLPELLRFLQNYYQIVFNIIILLGAIFFPKGWVNAIILLFGKFKNALGFGHKSGGKMGTLLQIENLTKRFAGLVAVNDLSISIDKRTIHALIGPNGSGKTTTVNLITGVLPLTAGKVSFEDRQISGMPTFRIARAGIGRTFQNIKVFPSMSLLENVMVGGHEQANIGLISGLFRFRTANREEKMLADKAEKILDYIGMRHLINERMENLPYGRQKISELARAMMNDPHLILLDEPAAGLNPSERNEFVAVITKIFKDGTDFFLIEHNMDVVMNISNRITVLNFGSKIAEGTPSEIQNNDDVIRAYLGERYRTTYAQQTKIEV